MAVLSGTMQNMGANRTDGFDRIADLPDDGLREKEVYARYGLAMFHAQGFEHALITLIMAHLTAERPESHERNGANDFRELMDELHSRTAGRLLARLRQSPGLSEPLDDLLKKAVQVRNRLAHRWFRERGLNFASVEGMQVMVDDLDDAMETLRSAGAQAYALAIQTFMAMGIDERDIERVRDRLAGRE